jgi:hypothetical protein
MHTTCVPRTSSHTGPRVIVVFSAWHDVIVVIVSAKKFGRKKPPCGGLAGEPVGLGRGALDHFTLGRFVDAIA